MSDQLKLPLALGGFLALIAALAGIAGWVLYLDLGPEQRAQFVALIAGRGELLFGLALLGLGVLGTLFGVAWQIWVRGSARLAEGLGIILDANEAHRLDIGGPPELRRLAESANALAHRYETLTRDLEIKAAAARASVEEEKNRLAALMSELSQGVLVCNIDGRVLLYNERARLALGAAEPGGSAAPIGLGRSVFAIIDRNLIDHALEDVRTRLAAGSPDLNAQFVTTLRAGQFLRVQLAPVLAAAAATPASAGAAPARAIGGFVMTVENITRAFERETTRDMLLQSLTEGSRASIGNIRAAIEMLMHYPDCRPEERDRFLEVIDEEAGKLGSALDRTMADYADSLKTRWPLEDMLGADVVAAAQRRIEARHGLPTKAENLDAGVWIKADTFALIRALAYLAGRLKDEYDVREVRFALGRDERLAQLDLIWSGAVLSSQTLYAWEMDAMRVGGEDSPLTLRDVTDRHGAEIVFIVEKTRHRACFRMLLPLATPARRAPAQPPREAGSRPEFYDFDLFHQAGQNAQLDQCALTDLSYTVFDTETTGLEPSAGDEIISLGAVRIVNNRLLRQETMEQLVDPQRPTSAQSAQIHGLTHEMLRGQPTIDAVLPRFWEFCEDTVLVAHNAAFDMRFLQMKEERTGIRFTQPVLDTLLLSQVLHPNEGSHTLEAIAARLGVPLRDRHTALGDAMVTGEVFLRMITLLGARGIRTLGEARAAAERTMYARVEY
jgi:DNA polymerase-3 subunit epsilon